MKKTLYKGLIAGSGERGGKVGEKLADLELWSPSMAHKAPKQADGCFRSASRTTRIGSRMRMGRKTMKT